MSELRDTIVEIISSAVADEVMKHIPKADPPWVDERSYDAAKPAADSIMALIEQSRPSREEFGLSVGALERAVVNETLSDLVASERDKLQSRVGITKAARREVMRMAGYPEER